MKNEIKKGLQWGYQLGFVLLLFLPLTAGVSATRASYPPPEPSILNQSTGSVTFGWAPVSGASGYKVYYYRKEASFTSQEQTTGAEPVFSGLPAGTYKFFFKSVFGSESSEYVVLDDIIIM